MLAVICLSLLVAASAAPAPQKVQESEPQARSAAQTFVLGGAQGAQQIPAGAQIVYLQGYGGQYASAPAQGQQIAYILASPQAQEYQYTTQQFTQPQQVQVKFSQPQTQVQLQQVEYKAPEIKTKVFAAPAPAPPAPVVKQYNVHENQVPTWAIIRQSLDDNFDGSFAYDFETENGIALQATGGVKQLSPKEQAQVIQGQYSYTAPDGTVITTSYTADENGFVAHGDHLPQAPTEPELPPLIAKSLAYIRSLPPQPEYQQ
ncbi:uncharacterized protein LOC128981925 [Macrosteles quadrilineatus]|uniref:uncharacterized protein LOC128981925 n=1 Tax=Macrosteles quadrilineatus TaxID=74068 RepID=UPI0023E20079|nr:uncharacterized protein LOC128981925 [Macrosteles quadrilineatus]